MINCMYYFIQFHILISLYNGNITRRLITQWMLSCRDWSPGAVYHALHTYLDGRPWPRQAHASREQCKHQTPPIGEKGVFRELNSDKINSQLTKFLIRTPNFCKGHASEVFREIRTWVHQEGCAMTFSLHRYPSRLFLKLEHSFRKMCLCHSPNVQMLSTVLPKKLSPKVQNERWR